MTNIKLEQSIYEKLPQIPYIIDQVGSALNWAKDELSEGEYYKTLKLTDEVADFVVSISNPNFFKTHLVIASILSSIPDVTSKEKFKEFDSTSQAVKNTLEAILVPLEKVKENGCFKATLLQLVPLAKQDETLFTLVLIGIKQDLQEVLEGMKKVDVNEPITSKDYVSILGYALVMANLRMANLKLLNRTYIIYNDILKLLNNIKY